MLCNSWPRCSWGPPGLQANVVDVVHEVSLRIPKVITVVGSNRKSHLQTGTAQ